MSVGQAPKHDIDDLLAAVTGCANLPWLQRHLTLFFAAEFEIALLKRQMTAI